MSDDYFCICDEGWCYCTNMVPTPDETCPECAAGHHVWTMGGERS